MKHKTFKMRTRSCHSYKQQILFVAFGFLCFLTPRNQLVQSIVSAAFVIAKSGNVNGLVQNKENESTMKTLRNSLDYINLKQQQKKKKQYYKVSTPRHLAMDEATSKNALIFNPNSPWQNEHQRLSTAGTMARKGAEAENVDQELTAEESDPCEEFDETVTRVIIQPFYVHFKPLNESLSSLDMDVIVRAIETVIYDYIYIVKRKLFPPNTTLEMVLLGKVEDSSFVANPWSGGFTASVYIVNGVVEFVSDVSNESASQPVIDAEEVSLWIQEALETNPKNLVQVLKWQERSSVNLQTVKNVTFEFVNDEPEIISNPPRVEPNKNDTNVTEVPANSSNTTENTPRIEPNKTDTNVTKVPSNTSNTTENESQNVQPVSVESEISSQNDDDNKTGKIVGSLFAVVAVFGMIALLAVRKRQRDEEKTRSILLADSDDVRAELESETTTNNKRLIGTQPDSAYDTNEVFGANDDTVYDESELGQDSVPTAASWLTNKGSFIRIVQRVLTPSPSDTNENENVTNDSSVEEIEVQNNASLSSLAPKHSFRQSFGKLNTPNNSLEDSGKEGQKEKELISEHNDSTSLPSTSTSSPTKGSTIQRFRKTIFPYNDSIQSDSRRGTMDSESDFTVSTEVNDSVMLKSIWSMGHNVMRLPKWKGKILKADSTASTLPTDNVCLNSLDLMSQETESFEKDRAEQVAIRKDMMTCSWEKGNRTHNNINWNVVSLGTSESESVLQPSYFSASQEAQARKQPRQRQFSSLWPWASSQPQNIVSSDSEVSSNGKVLTMDEYDSAQSNSASYRSTSNHVDSCGSTTSSDYDCENSMNGKKNKNEHMASVEVDDETEVPTVEEVDNGHEVILKSMYFR